MTDTLQDNKFMFGSKEITCQYCKKTLPSKFCKRHSLRTSITHRVYSATSTPQHQDKLCPTCDGLNGHRPTDLDRYGAIHPDHRTVPDLATPQLAEFRNETD